MHLHVSSGLRNAVGQDSDHGDGEDVAEPVRDPRFGSARPGAPGCVRRQSDGALRTRPRPDGGYPEQAGCRKDLQTIRSFTNAPLRVVVNTHIHGDHTGANAFFAKQGALIYSQENLRNEMLRPPRRANGQPAPAPDMAAVPVVTYNYNPATSGQAAVTFNMNGETVDFIPMMPSHTAGDTIVRFRKANVIYIEDFYRNFGYPFADQANGGSIRGMLDAIDLIQELADPATTLVPGHGTLVKKNDLLPYRQMIMDVMSKVKTLRDQGKS